MLLENDAVRLAPPRVATHLQFMKTQYLHRVIIKVSAEVKPNKMSMPVYKHTHDPAGSDKQVMCINFAKKIQMKS